MTNGTDIAGAAPATPAATLLPGASVLSTVHVVVGMLLLLTSLAISACARPEDPARAQLRARLAQEARLSDQELSQLCDEVERAVDGKNVRITEHSGSRTPDGDQRSEVFSLLRDRAGVFDEGLKRDSGITYRILNGPGKSDNAEIEATQRLWVDIETLVPRRYEFTYAFQGYGDYAFDLAVQE